MVFYGYELPKKNNEIRLKNVSTSIANANTRKLNNINQQDQTLSLNMDTLTSSTQTSLPSSIFTPAVLTKGLQKTDINEFNRQAITPTSTNNTPATGRAPNLIDELKNKLKNPMFGLTRGLTKNEVKFKEKLLNELKEKIGYNKDDVKMVKEIVDDFLNTLIQSGITPKEEEIVHLSIDEFMKQNKNESESEAPTELTGISLENAEKEIGDLKNIETIEKFYNWFMKNQKTFSPEGAKRAVNTKIPYEYDGKNKKWITKTTLNFNPKYNSNKIILDKAFNEFTKDKEGYANAVQGIHYKAGAGLIGGRIATGHYYNSHAPNFGNLYITNKSLKKNNLTISRPYSKTQLLSKKNITPLLKKMIFDIANTLEFDKQDYHNLQKDEKIIIEKIIRLQKDMKDVNINKLLEDDDSKIKKRIEILIGEVNAGNVSSLIKKELKDLLKKLYDNKAISYNKYQQSLKSINVI